MQFQAENAIITIDETSGFYQIQSAPNDPLVLLKNLYSTVRIGKQNFTNIGMRCTVISSPYEDDYGVGTRYRVSYIPESNQPEPIKHQIDIIHYQGKPFLAIEGTITNISSTPQEISYYAPCSLLASHEGGLYLGSNAEDTLIFENGLSFAFEFYMRSFSADQESDSMYMEYIYSKENQGNNFLMGIGSLPKFLCEIISNDEEDEVELDGRTGIAEWRAQLTFPFPKTLPPLESIHSGRWIFGINAKSGFDALETYADYIREFNHIRVWPHDVPHGWNSWNNPIDQFREMSYITNINENIILSNLDLAVDNLKEYGFKYWQLDNGYSSGKVMMIDEIMEDRFPHGMQYIADEIHKNGLRAGIWINPFNAGIESPLFKEKEKEGWFPEPDPSFPVHDSSWRCLDLSIPAVQDYIRHGIKKVVYEWGYDLLKVDFSYMNMGPTKFANASMTAPELHRLGYQLLRDAAGPQIFIFGIGGPIGLHYGIIDGERISLDTLPQWHPEKVQVNQFDVPQTEGSLLFNYRTFARRYFYHNRVWMNHLDCFSFRPSLTRNEAMCLVNATALLGGIWKIGDRLVDLSAEDFRVIQKMTPIYRDGARPRDVFRTLIPEILHLEVHSKINPGYEKTWDVVGLFHWGPNRDLLTEEETTGDTKEMTIDFLELGLQQDESYHVFDFWNETYKGIHQNSFSVTISPRSSNIYSIQKKLSHPHWISTNRHITQGAYSVINEIWDTKQKTLTLDLELVANDEFRVFIFIPSEFQLINSEVIESKIKISQKHTISSETVAYIELTAATSSKKTTLKLSFE